VGKRDELDAIEVVSPCTAPWSGMVGDERVRFCGQCRKHVYNLAEMTTDEARRLITTTEGKSVCARVTRRADGTVVTGSCRARLRAARERGPLAFAGALLVVFAIQVWAQAFGLRALSAFLRREPSQPTADEIARAPVVHGSRPVRSPRLAALHDLVAMGGVRVAHVPTEATAADGSVLRKIPPSLAMTLKKSGDAPELARSLRQVGQAREVFVWVSVARSGTVDDVLVDEVEPVRTLVEGAVKTWTFRPLLVDGAPVPFSTVVKLGIE
jgi:hypothetical protein